MANIRTLQRSFSGGELTPEFFGRIDDAKYAAGLAVCRNFIPKPHGPASNRPGFAFVREVKNSTSPVRLIPFTFSTTQTMVIEMGAGYFRFHTYGATLLHDVEGVLVPYKVAHPYTASELFDVHYVQSADVLTFVHPNHAPRELRRLGATNWQMATIAFAPPTAPTAPTATRSFTGEGTAEDRYTYYYVVTAIGPDEISESFASPSASVAGNLYQTGQTITVTWAAVTGASRYYVYKLQGGLYGYIGETDALSITDDDITPDLSKTPPRYDTAFQSAGDYPGAVSYYEQRRCFAGTLNKPQNIWLTRSGTESDLSYSLPLKDDDRISFRVAAREANTIRHIVPLSQLLLLTSSAEWVVTSLNSDAITPTSISVRPQSYVGASNVQPVIINNTLIYGAARGGHVREMAYNWQASGFLTGDLSLRAPHLFDGLDIVDMAYSKSPSPVVWFVSSNGNLLGLTYVPEQQIGAWHRHDTDGVFESIAVVAEGHEDVLYAVVRRTINGQSRRYVERMASRVFQRQEDAFFVDCGGTLDGRNTGNTTLELALTGGANWDSGNLATLYASAGIFIAPDEGRVFVLQNGDDRVAVRVEQYVGADQLLVELLQRCPESLRDVQTKEWAFTFTQIGGLSFLEGKTVSIMADGAVHPQRVVTGGSITLDEPAAVIHVGLPITADIQTLPLAANLQDGSFGQGRTKNVNKVWLRVHESSGIFVGPNAENLTEAKQRGAEPYGRPPALKTEEIPIMVKPSWGDSGQVFVRQSDPLPLTLVSATFEVALGG